jgi:hypothetical protein
MAPPATGIYNIRSQYLNDNRCVDVSTDGKEIVQLMPCNKAQEQRFKVSLNDDGTYAILTLVIAPAGTETNLPITYEQADGGPTDGYYYYLAIADPQDIGWSIQQAAGQNDPNTMNIISADASTLKENGDRSSDILSGTELTRPTTGGFS